MFVIYWPLWIYQDLCYIAHTNHIYCKQQRVKILTQIYTRGIQQCIQNQTQLRVSTLESEHRSGWHQGHALCTALHYLCTQLSVFNVTTISDSKIQNNIWIVTHHNISWSDLKKPNFIVNTTSLDIFSVLSCKTNTMKLRCFFQTVGISIHGYVLAYCVAM